ncbi:MAG: Nramp family divalent metal transporter [Planctomycetes bacterium]|nr:Nramp family divalent metal transporter [Planctomycetota bacterium]
MVARRRTNRLDLILPGILVAATGVGAGDLATAGLAGAKLGVGVAWAVIFGAVLKWVLNEGLARWQMATGTTLLEGWIRRLRLQWVFLTYLVLWSFVVGGALINASGVAASALFPLTDDPDISKRIWGITHSLAGVVLVFLGGFKLFEKMMAVFIGVMFVSVTYCAVRIAPTLDLSNMAFVNPFQLDPDQRQWVLALIGGVGGTLTLLSYGYWIRERNRAGSAGMRLCRIDLSIGYAMTTLFGVAMLVIAAATPEIVGKGASLIALLGDKLGDTMGVGFRYVFLLGAWGAIFSSLLGVWQSVPYMFADFLSETRWIDASRRTSLDHAGSRPYNWFLLYLALPPIITLWMSFVQIQLIYAVLGAFFMPLLAVTLLIMNNRRDWVAAEFRNGILVNIFLVMTLAFFA